MSFLEDNTVTKSSIVEYFNIISKVRFQLSSLSVFSGTAQKINIRNSNSVWVMTNKIRTIDLLVERVTQSIKYN